MCSISRAEGTLHARSALHFRRIHHVPLAEHIVEKSTCSLQVLFSDSPCWAWTMRQLRSQARFVSTNDSRSCRIMMSYRFKSNKRKETKRNRHAIAYLFFLLAPPAGLEPATSWLTVMRSTDWAKEEYEVERDTRCSVSLSYVGYDLSFRSVSRQVFSALQSLTSVFGMGTGGPFALETLTNSSFICLSQTMVEFGSRHCRVVHLQGFEPGTHWLRVSCSTNWAKGANVSAHCEYMLTKNRIKEVGKKAKLKKFVRMLN